MGSLTSAQLKAIGNFDADTITNLTADLNAGQDVDAVSAAGALSLTRVRTELTVSGTKAYTLAAPTLVNQRKVITCVSAASTPLGSVTISSPDDTTGFVCATVFTFTAVGQEIELEATSALKWRCKRVKRAGMKTAIEAGVTSLTNLRLVQVYSLAVDGTDAGSSTTAIPDGSTPGERCSVVCESAANTPIGSVTGTFLGMFGTSYTTIGAIGVAASTTVVGDVALLEWNGSAWVVIYQNGCTLS